MLLKATELFTGLNGRIMKVAKKAGEITWRKGILKASGGLMTGTSGNGYFLHSLFRTFSKLAKESQNKIMKRKLV